MKRLLVASAVTSLLLLGQSSATRAATVTLSITAALQPVSSENGEAPTSAKLAAKLSYDADAGTASGRFVVAGTASDFQGSAQVDGEGFYFDGSAADATTLFINIATRPDGPGTVRICPNGGLCSFYTTLGGTVSDGGTGGSAPASPDGGGSVPNDSGSTLPDPGVGSGSGLGGLPGDGGTNGAANNVPALPLPAALPLHAGALLILAGLSRRLAGRPALASIVDQRKR